MPPNFTISEANEADFPEIAAMVATSFNSMPVEALITGPLTAPNLNATANRYLHAHRQHQEQYRFSPTIKCTHTDPSTGVQTIIATAQWYMFPRPRSDEEVATPHPLLGCGWMSDSAEKVKVVEFFRPFVEGRVRWMGKRPHGLLMYLAVLPGWRRKGVGRMCVQWGVERCDELGIPAYLEASELGRPVYEGVGFETVEEIEWMWEGERGMCPVMIRWPRGAGAGRGNGNE